MCALVILLKRNKAFRITREDLRINSWCRIALQIGLNGVDRQLDGARILEGNITTGVKNSEQFTRVRQSSKGNSTVPDLACIYSSIQAGSLSVNIPFYWWSLS